jgi:hypothetical protein
MPLNVSTWISPADFSDDSSNTAVLTFVVMTESSTISPVPSCVGVDAQPMIEDITSVTKKAG